MPFSDDYYAKGSRHDHHSHKQWTQEEDQQITAPDKPADMVLAERLGRTVHAIEDRRYALKHGVAPNGGLARPRTIRSCPDVRTTSFVPAAKPMTELGARIRAIAMGFSPAAGASVEAIQLQMRRYKPYKDIGIAKGLKVGITGLGQIEVLEILPGSMKASVKTESGGERLVPLEQLRFSLAEQRRNSRRGGR